MPKQYHIGMELHLFHRSQIELSEKEVQRLKQAVIDRKAIRFKNAMIVVTSFSESPCTTIGKIDFTFKAVPIIIGDLI